MKEGMICVVYVDDTIFTGSSGEDLGICSDRNVHSFQLRNEGEVGNLLGIQIKKTGPREFSLTQPGLIEKIHKVTGMSDVNGTHTPTTGAPVGTDYHGLVF